MPPSTKSSLSSSKDRRPSLLSSMASVPNLLSTASHDKESSKYGGRTPPRSATLDTFSHDDDPGAKPQRRKSRLNILTSFFLPTSSSGSTPNSSSSARPRTAHDALPPSVFKKELDSQTPASSTLEFNKGPSSVDNSPSTSSNHHDSVSTIDNSPGRGGFGMHTPATQNSDLDFGFGFDRTESPEVAEAGAGGKSGTHKPTVLQKTQKRSSSYNAPPERSPPILPKVTVPTDLPEVEVTETPISPILPRPNYDTRSISANGPVSPQSHDGPAKLKSTRRPSSPPTSAPRTRSISAQPPLNGNLQADGSRAVSSPIDPNTFPRPMSKHDSDGESRGRVRRSWLPGSNRSRSGSKDLKKMPASKAWILAPDSQADYNTHFLANREKVPELWNENGDVLVYLSPRGSDSGPSFKIPTQSIEASIIFHELIQEELESSSGRDRATSFSGRDSLAAQDADCLSQQSGTPEPVSGEVRLYIPPAPLDQQGAHKASKGKASKEDPELQRLVAIRNLFAFLTGQPLVGTKYHPTMFSAFLEISNLLKEFDFMSMDGTTWGDAVDMSFSFYMAQLSLADVRYSREKTLEAVILGERMKCWELYNEAFTHAVGKWQAIVSLKSPLTKHVSLEVMRRLERSNLDLLNRQHNVNSRLENLEFPALFSGVAGSSEFKDVRWGRWKSSFARMRGFTLGYYKSLFGAWPPKARSKKNPFSESGLNRLVLKALYTDLCSLYDLLVDRDSVTPRVIDQAVDDVSEKETNEHIKALRKILTEFDQSSPPVLPPIPFDVPKLPAMKSVLTKYEEMKEKDQAKFDRNIKEHELQLVMHMSYNFDTDSMKSPFLKEFKDFDIENSRGKTQAEIIDNRLGAWLFLYVVIQSLPLLVIDAPDLEFTEGVEYFLCQPPMGNPPWLEEAGEVRKAWYQLPGSQVKVELSTDVVMFSVEGTFERSHCWEAAARWDEAKMNGEAAGMLGLPPPPPMEATTPMSPLHAPRAVFEDNDPVTGAGAGTSGHIGGGGSPASSAPGSPSFNPQRRLHAPGSGLAAGHGAGSSYRASFAGLTALEPLPPPLGAAPVDRRSSRVFSAQMAQRTDSFGSTRPLSMAESGTSSIRNARSVGNLRGESPAGKSVGAGQNNHERQMSSTFDDILKDMSNQQQKPVKEKKKFGF